MQRRTYVKLRNWLIAPALWATTTMLAAALLGVELNWRVVLVIIFAQLASDFIDFSFERRPFSGPRRWE
jgi:hypothetical protein